MNGEGRFFPFLLNMCDCPFISLLDAAQLSSKKRSYSDFTCKIKVLNDEMLYNLLLNKTYKCEPAIDVAFLLQFSIAACFVVVFIRMLKRLMTMCLSFDLVVIMDHLGWNKSIFG